MTIQAIRLKNFLIFDDSGWLELLPITFLFGRNSSGKSTLGYAFNVLQSAMGTRNPFQKSTALGIDHFSQLLFNSINNGAQEEQISFEFRCSPGLGLVSKINEFSRFRNLNVQETELVVTRLNFARNATNSQNDIGTITSVSIELHESRTIKDVADGDWKEIKEIFGINKNLLTSNSWTFSSDFLNLDSALYILTGLTIDETRLIPSLKDTSNLIAFTDNELGDPNFDPYKNPDDPRSIARYVMLFLEDVSYEIIGFLDSVEFINPQNTITNLKTNLKATDELFDRLFNTLMLWSKNFSIGHSISSEELQKLIDDLIAGKEQEVSLRLGAGFITSIKSLLMLISFERDKVVFIQHPDTLLDSTSQLQLADYLTTNAFQEANKLIIETNNEYLLLRVMKRLRQTNEQRLPADLDFLANEPDLHKKVGIVVVAKHQQGGSRCFSINFDKTGAFREPWPGGFFEESFTERFIT